MTPTSCSYCPTKPIQVLTSDGGRMMFLCRNCCIQALSVRGISPATRQVLEAAIERAQAGQRS